MFSCELLLNFVLLYRKAFDNSFTHISELNEDLQHQIEALSNQMIEVKRENRIKGTSITTS